MQEYLPKEAYKAVVDATEKGTPISREMADLIANGMKKLGKIAQCDTLHALVSATDRRNGRET